MSNDTYSYRVITRKQAEYLGMSASVAGGYVAVDGPRIDRIPSAEYSRIESEVDRISTDGCSDDAYAAEQDSLLVAYRHTLRGGDRATVSISGQGIVLKAPVGAHMAGMGYPVPTSMLDEVITLLRRAGYEA